MMPPVNMFVLRMALLLALSMFFAGCVSVILFLLLGNPRGTVYVALHIFDAYFLGFYVAARIDMRFFDQKKSTR